MKFKGVNESGSPIEADTLEEYKAAGGQSFIWNVSMALNVRAYTQDEAFQKVAAYLRNNYYGVYEELEGPILQPNITADDCETLIG